MPIDLTPAVKKAAEHLDTCDYILFHEGLDDAGDEEDYDDAVDNLVAPFCGCNVCLAREAIFASFHLVIEAFLNDLFAYNKDPENAPCCIVGKRSWKYHVALLDISEGAENPKDLALKALGMKKEDK